MKMKKIVAMLLALVMVVGVATACKSKVVETTTVPAATTTAKVTDATTAAPTTAVTTATSTTPPNIVPPATVTDTDTTPIVIYAWNNEFQGLIDKYYVPDHAGFTYNYQITETTTYQTKLDSVLATGDGAPDIFLVEADYAKKYVNADTSLNINELGIDYKELANQYGYTYLFMKDDAGAIKALSWQACPSGIFYEKSLAQQYLGSSAVADVQKSFASFDSFMAMAQKLNKDSAGKVKAISGYDDIWRSFANSRATGWVVDGKINIDPQMDKYLDYAKQIKDEGLSFETAQWSADWTANMSNKTVLSYWGPMWMGQYSMGFNYAADGKTLAAGANATTGDWDFCAAPVSFFWGGTWITASKYDNQKATTADIMRYFTIDSTSMAKMAADGQFVNNVPVMTTVANDTTFGINFLGGANPIGLMLKEAMKIDVSTVTGNDAAINTIWGSTVAAYTQGTIKTVAEAKAQFITDCADIIVA